MHTLTCDPTRFRCYRYGVFCVYIYSNTHRPCIFRIFAYSALHWIVYLCWLHGTQHIQTHTLSTCNQSMFYDERVDESIVAAFRRILVCLCLCLCQQYLYSPHLEIAPRHILRFIFFFKAFPCVYHSIHGGIPYTPNAVTVSSM